MKFFQMLPSLEKYGIHTMGCSIWGLTRFQSLWRSKLCELSCHFTLWNSQRSSGVSKILILQSNILNNVNSSMQSSAGKGIVFRAALSSSCSVFSNKPTLKASQNHQTVKTGQSKIAIRQKIMTKHPRILALPTQLQIFIKISRIEFPGNQVKTFISLESVSFTESKTLFRLQKSPQ